MPISSSFRFARPGCLAALMLFSGCGTVTPGYEQAARRRLSETSQAYRPNAAKPVLPELSQVSTPRDYLRFALLNHPQVEAAFDQWRAAVSAITPARALPDPKLTFQADIADSLLSLMPGLMFDFMNPGKRAALGKAASAEAEVARRRFIAAEEDVARRLREAWIELAYVNAARQLHVKAARSIKITIDLASTAFATGRDAGGLARQIALESEFTEHHAHHAILGDRRRAARLEFKAALGLPPAAPDPPWPGFPLKTGPLPAESMLWSRIVARNPRLATLRAIVDQSIASVAVSEKAGAPDFSLGAMVDLKMNPLMVRPEASLSLPLWREKIAGQVAAARAQLDAAGARIDQSKLELAARFARTLYTVRRTDHMLTYLDDTARPNLERLVAVNRANYESGRTGLAALSRTRTQSILLQLQRLDLLRERADAVTELLYLSAAVAPREIAALSP